MGSFIMKAAKDRDLYCEWSSIVDSPPRIGTHEEMRRDGVSNDRLDRADEYGTSLLGFASHGDYPPSELDGAWEDTGFVVEQRGWLPRARVADFLEALLADDEQRAYALLEPFEDDGTPPTEGDPRE